MNAQLIERYPAYPSSIHSDGDKTVYMTRGKCEDYLIITGNCADFEGEENDDGGARYKKAPLNHHNAQALRKLFAFTAPSAVLGEKCTMGVGDRLGVAGEGLLRVFKKHPSIRPILAQQSMRELNFTGRTYHDVIDSATFAVFKAGYTSGFGADGDHLKTPAEIKNAIACGCTMITLDCSEHIDAKVSEMSDEQAQSEYAKSPGDEREYIGKVHLSGYSFSISRDEFVRMHLIYKDAIAFAKRIYDEFIKGASVDFELSIDETQTPTSPSQHYYVAQELKKRGVVLTTIAPKFCGEFQKGIDYIGDISQFRGEFEAHCKIAEHFGYKISVHSGSDKFSVFPIIGELTGGNFHLKTAGTNWLEAMRTVAAANPALYRQVHKYALEVFPDACKFYHVKANVLAIPDVDTLPDQELTQLFQNEHSRQLIHITYGYILGLKQDGKYVFKDKLYALWHDKANLYADFLEAHIGKHVEQLHSKLM